MGLEYLVTGVFGHADLSPVLEYSHDDRDNDTPNIFDEDLFTGLRLDFNDAAGTALEGGALIDMGNGTMVGLLEMSRRFGGAWNAEIKGRVFSIRGGDESFLQYFRRDHHIQGELRRYF